MLTTIHTCFSSCAFDEVHHCDRVWCDTIYDCMCRCFSVVCQSIDAGRINMHRDQAQAYLITWWRLIMLVVAARCTLQCRCKNVHRITYCLDLLQQCELCTSHHSATIILYTRRTSATLCGVTFKRFSFEAILCM